MTLDDYKLLIHICNHCLRSNNLTLKQINDIDKVLTKLYNRVFTQENIGCSGKKLKVGAKKKDTKRTGKKLKAQTTPIITHG